MGRSCKLILVLFGFLALVAALAAAKSWMVAVNGRFQGHQVSAPLYDPKVTFVDQRRRDFDTKIFDEMKNFVDQLTEKALLQRVSILRMGLQVKSFKSLLGRLKDENNKLTGEGVGPKHDDDFMESIAHLFKEILKHAREEKLEKGDSSEEEVKRFIQEQRQFMEMLRETVRNSPVGTYIDWNELKVDGKPLKKAAAYYFSFFTKNGYGIAAILLELLARYLELKY